MILLIVLFFALLGSGFFSGMETGILSINRLRLQHLVRRNVANADILQKFVQYPEWMLSTTLIGTNICNVAIPVLVTVELVNFTFLPEAAVNALAFFLPTIAILVLGEYLPKAWFQSNPVPRVLPYVKLLHFFGKLFWPLGSAISTLVRISLSIFPRGRLHNDDDAGRLTREELHKLLSREQRQHTSLSEQKRYILENILNMQDKCCRDIMIPRDQMTIVPDDISSREMIEISRRPGRRHQRLPVYSRTHNRFVGIINVLEVLRTPDWENMPLSAFVRPPLYTGEQTPADDLLVRFRISKQPLLLVQDPQQQVVGCVTTEVVLALMLGPL